MVRAKGKRPRQRNQNPNLVEWVAEYPGAKVTRKELYLILAQIIGRPEEESEPKEVEA